jgi:hypothetical protein
MLSICTHNFRRYIINAEYLIFSQSTTSKSILMTFNNFVYFFISQFIIHNLQNLQ